MSTLELEDSKKEIRDQVSQELTWIQELLMKEAKLNAMEAKQFIRDVISTDL